LFLLVPSLGGKKKEKRKKKKESNFNLSKLGNKNFPNTLIQDIILF